MKHKKIVAISLILIVILLGVSLLVFYQRQARDLPGDVIGPNPNHIPENKLPECNFNGADFVEQPCYSPPNSFYF